VGGKRNTLGDWETLGGEVEDVGDVMVLMQAEPRLLNY